MGGWEVGNIDNKELERISKAFEGQFIAKLAMEILLLRAERDKLKEKCLRLCPDCQGTGQVTIREFDDTRMNSKIVGTRPCICRCG